MYYIKFKMACLLPLFNLIYLPGDIWQTMPDNWITHLDIKQNVRFQQGMCPEKCQLNNLLV